MLRFFTSAFISSAIIPTRTRPKHFSSLIEVIEENSFKSIKDWLILEPPKNGNKPRQILNAHYCDVSPEPCSKPVAVGVSTSCLSALNFPMDSYNDPDFALIFSGNELPSCLDTPYATNYGCHSYGQWFGQLGDGRAMALGEILNPASEKTYELQLKGSGRTPFSRGFDGRAVMRSSVREFLASEAMFHLQVPTTRALSVIGTGDTVQRPWYSTTSSEVTEDELLRRNVSGKYPPNTWKSEPGAVLCRVARSFLRLGHLELFAIREEYKELLQLADYACFREFPHLLSMDIPERYIELYRIIAQSNAKLVVEWLRVGYVQGNMNSDNTCIAGRTIDYGPFGWMEAFDPKYQPFTTDRDGHFAFLYQPSAMQINIKVLGEKTFVPLIRESLKTSKKKYAEWEVNDYITQIYKIATDEFSHSFWTAFSNMKRCKLGLRQFSEAIKEDTQLWARLESLLFKSKCDYTIFFRELGDLVRDHVATPEEALDILQPSFYSNVLDNEIKQEWLEWLQVYFNRLKKEESQWSSLEERTEIQARANPKYILRNWMAVQAYESAEQGDYALVKELYEVLSDPYAMKEATDASLVVKNKKWYSKTPSWASNMPGCTFMSCSS